MNRPQHPEHYYDRQLDCQAAMEDYFNEIMDAAWEAGWTPAEASTAIVDLADNFMLKLFANDETMRQLIAAQLKRQ